MTFRSKPHVLVPLLALGISLALAASAGAQDRQYRTPTGTAATLRVHFGTTLHWGGITGTRVEELPMSERPNYDVFRYGGAYYVHDNDRWFMSRQESGDYTAMDDRDVPAEFSTIPRDHWRNYPSGWNDPRGRDQGRDRMPMTLQVNVGFARWSYIRGTRVQSIRGPQRPEFDLFRYGGVFYAFEGNRWYSSNRSRGEYTRIDDRSLPGDLMRIPRYAWRNYPPRWLDANGNVRADLVSRDRNGRRNY